MKGTQWKNTNLETNEENVNEPKEKYGNIDKSNNNNDSQTSNVLDKNKNVRQKPALLPKPQLSNNAPKSPARNVKLEKAQSSTQTVTVNKLHSQSNINSKLSESIIENNSSVLASQTQTHSISSTLTYFQNIESEIVSKPITPPKRNIKITSGSKPDLPPKTLLKSGVRRTAILPGKTSVSQILSLSETKFVSNELEPLNTSPDITKSGLMDRTSFSPTLIQEIHLKKFDKIIQEIGTPVRPPRSPKIKNFKNGPFEILNTSDPNWIKTKKKSASLARTENLKWSHNVNTYKKFVDQSADNCKTFYSKESPPIPHPRHKNKLKFELDLALRSSQSHFDSYQTSLPIYATVDYSKKKNRRIVEVENKVHSNQDESLNRSSSSIDSFKSLEDSHSFEQKPTFFRTLSEPASCSDLLDPSIRPTFETEKNPESYVSNSEENNVDTDMDSSVKKNKSILYEDILTNKTEVSNEEEQSISTNPSSKNIGVTKSTNISPNEFVVNSENNIARTSSSEANDSLVDQKSNVDKAPKDRSHSFLHNYTNQSDTLSKEINDDSFLEQCDEALKSTDTMPNESTSTGSKVTSTPKIDKTESFYDCEESHTTVKTPAIPGITLSPDKTQQKGRNKSYLLKKDNDSSLTESDATVYSSKRLGSWLGSFGKGHRKNKNVKERCTSQFYTQTPSECQLDLNDRSRALSLPDIKNTVKDSYLCGNSKQDEFEGNSSAADTISNCSEISSILQHSESDDEVDLQEQSTTDDVKQRKAFYKARELMTSEAVLIDVLKLLNVDFRKFVEKSSDPKQRVIPESDLQKILNHLPQLQALNEDLYSDIKQRIERWKENPKIADVIVRKGPFLKLYTTYIQNFESQCSHLEECCIKYPRFGRVVKDFEATDRCKKLTLRFYMLKPVQRIVQYRMLLSDYMKYLSETSPDYNDTKTALTIMSDVADHANRSMKHGDQISRMIQLQSQLGDFQLIKPGRELIKEGELEKLCRKTMQARYFILLNDSLLYTSYYGSMTSLRVNHSLPLSNMKVVEDEEEGHHYSFTLMSVTKSFKLRAKSEHEKHEWVEALKNAIQDYDQRQRSFLNTKQIIDPSETSFKLGKGAPVWIQDSNVTMCQICTAEFTALFRRHHCRACGKVVCGRCSENQAPLEYNDYKVSRVCDSCYDFLHEEFDNKTGIMEVLRLRDYSNDSDVLENIYQSLKSRFLKSESSGSWKKKKFIPPRLKEVSAKDSDCLMKGYLQRKSKKAWKSYWFVLKEQVLYVYKACEDVVAIDSIPVLGYEVDTSYLELDDSTKKPVFRLLHKKLPPMMFLCESEEQNQRWVEAMKKAVVL